MKKWLIIGLVIVAGSLAACGQPAAPQVASTNEEGTAAETSSLSGELMVYAAASLTESFTEIGKAFEVSYPETTISFNFAGSQQLASQLDQGAPADIFASANTRQMNAAIESGRVVSGTTQIFTHNRLILIIPDDNPGEVNGLQDLAKPDLKIVLAAEDVPIGAYSRDFLDKAEASGDFAAGYHEAVLANVVSLEQTVKAVLAKVLLGEADAGIVYSSDIGSYESQLVRQLPIPDELNTIATYPIAVVADSAQSELAQTFIDYLLSEQGQATLAEYGFIPIEQPDEQSDE